MIAILVAIIFLSYMVGSIPSGLILVKVCKGIDITTIGSKNIGATNVLRAGFPLLALLTLLLDLSKGALAGLITQQIYQSTHLGILAGLFAILGHMYPVWLNFKGGKGVATTFGVLIALTPLLGALAILTWLLVAIISKYSSLAAIITFLLLPIYAWIIYPNIALYILVIAIFTLLKHKENALRLYKGKESKIVLKR